MYENWGVMDVILSGDSIWLLEMVFGRFSCRGMGKFYGIGFFSCLKEGLFYYCL